MKKLNSYIIKSYVGPFVFTFFICVFILLMQFLWKYLDELVGKGLENMIIIELMSYASMSLVPMALPLAVLLASIMAFGNLGERLELLAIKSSGVSLLRIMKPLIYLNIVVTIVAFVLADYVIPVTNAKFAALLWSVREQRPEMIIKEGVFSNDIDGYSIKVSGRDPKTKALLDIMIYNHTERKGNINVTLADSGYLNMSDDKQFMILKLYNGESYTDEKVGDRKAKDTNPFRREKFSHQELVISVKDFELKRLDEKYFKDNYKMLANRQLSYFADSLANARFEKERAMAVGLKYNQVLESQINNLYLGDSINIDLITNTSYNTTIDSLISNISDPNKTAVLNLALQIAQQNQRVILQYQSDLYHRMIWINKHLIEWHKKYTFAIACIMFFFIGAPLGAIIRKGGFGMPVVVSILLFISYYLFSMIGEKVSREGVWDIDIVMWVPTLFYLVLGVLLTHQAVTDSLLLNKETYNRFLSSINIIRRLKTFTKKIK